jgi:hypothetical protein
MYDKKSCHLIQKYYSPQMQTIAVSPALRRKTSRRRTLSRSKKTSLRSPTKKTSTGRYVTIYLSNTLASHYEDQAIMLKTTVGKLLKKQIEAKPLTVFDAIKDLMAVSEILCLESRVL